MKILKKYYDSWFIPIISASFFLIAGFFIITTISKKIAFNIGVICFGISIFLFIISIIFGIIKIFKKDYIKGIFQSLISATIVIISLKYIYFFLFFYPYDFFTDDLHIPENIELNLPAEHSFDEEKIIRPKITFDLINGFQRGLYEYNFTTKKIDSGYIYLKAFEITKNIRLSKEELDSDSKIFVYNPTDSLMTFSTKNNFTIYEGNWDTPYGAKFEVWYRPVKGSEKKLLEKNYKIFGWQR